MPSNAFPHLKRIPFQKKLSKYFNLGLGYLSGSTLVQENLNGIGARFAKFCQIQISPEKQTSGTLLKSLCNLSSLKLNVVGPGVAVVAFLDQLFAPKLIRKKSLGFLVINLFLSLLSRTSYRQLASKSETM